MNLEPTVRKGTLQFKCFLITANHIALYLSRKSSGMKNPILLCFLQGFNSLWLHSCALICRGPHWHDYTPVATQACTTEHRTTGRDSLPNITRKMERKNFKKRMDDCAKQTLKTNLLRGLALESLRRLWNGMALGTLSKLEDSFCCSYSS